MHKKRAVLFASPLLAAGFVLFLLLRPSRPVLRFEAAATHTVNGMVAEIVAATPDEGTLVYTDSDAKQISWVDITDPARPTEGQPLKMPGEPTSVAITPDGNWALYVVRDVLQKKTTDPAHLLVVTDVKTRRAVRNIPLAGQPDCIEISPDGKYAAIAIENERSEVEMPMPQSPAGWVSIFDLQGLPATWKERRVSMLNLAERFSTDPEPEYIAINARNEAAITLQENNAVVIIDLASGKILEHWSCGMTSHRADLQDDDKMQLTDELQNARREPDGIAWMPGGNLVTANEGDYSDDLKKKNNEFCGGRNFTVFSRNGEVLFDGNDLEQNAMRDGFYDDARSRKRGVEPENATVARFSESTFAFIACEYGSGAAVYDLSDEKQPRYLQWLKGGASPEGIVALPQRRLFVTANEGDGTLSLFQLQRQ